MSTATLTRRAPYAAPTGFIWPRDGACKPDIADLWSTKADYGLALHHCLRHCPLAVREECDRQVRTSPPQHSCVQAGVQWSGRRLVGGRLVPVATKRQPVETPCDACVAYREAEGLCSECGDAARPGPVSGGPTPRTCGDVCADRRRWRIGKKTGAEAA